MNIITDSQRSAAKIAGVAFLISLALVAYGNFGIRGALMATEDPAKTALLIDASDALFQFSVLFDLAFCTGFIVLLTALYVALSPVNQYLALLASVSKLVYVVTAVLLPLGFLTKLRLASDPAYAASLGGDAVVALVKLHSSAAWDQYYVGLFFWALSSTLFAWLWLRSRYVPAGLALFGVASSAWCAFCALAYVAYPAFSAAVNIWVFDTPMVLFYIALSFWLLFKGLRGSASPR